MEVLIRLKVRPEGFPNGSPMSLVRFLHLSELFEQLRDAPCDFLCSQTEVTLADVLVFQELLASSK